MRFDRTVTNSRSIWRRLHDRGWPSLRVFSDSGSVGPFYDNYTVRAASRPRNIYVRSAGFWIIWKETDPGITAILWYRDSPPPRTFDPFPSFFLYFFLVLTDRLSFLSSLLFLSMRKSRVDTIQRKTRNVERFL